MAQTPSLVIWQVEVTVRTGRVGLAVVVGGRGGDVALREEPDWGVDTYSRFLSTHQ